jgi:hypothetical protein
VKPAVRGVGHHLGDCLLDLLPHAALWRGWNECFEHGVTIADRCTDV